MTVFDYRSPSPALREYVRQYQIVGFFVSEQRSGSRKIVLAAPRNCLAFYPRDTVVIEHVDGRIAEWKPRATLIGQHSSVTNRKVGNDFILFQIVFQPGALCRLAGLPSHVLSNTFVDAEAIFSPEIHYVNERLSSTDNHLEMIGIVETFLVYLIRRQRGWKRSSGILPVDKVSQFMLHHPAHRSLDWLANQACLSIRQFYEQFMNRMGVSPKLFSRIIRFDQAVKLKNAFPNKDWLSVAIDSGYYDYQHLVRDYKEFTRMPPNGFFQQERNAPNERLAIPKPKPFSFDMKGRCY